MSPNASHRVRPGLSSAASLMTTLQISFDQEVLNQHLNLVTPEYPFFESPCGLLLVIFVTLANATGDPPTRFVDPTNDRDAATPLLADDPLLTSSPRINFHAPRANLDGGLSKDRCAGQQSQRDQDSILHHIPPRASSGGLSTPSLPE